MALEWIDVADTAVKVGLGALISGVATYAIEKSKRRREFQFSFFEKKISMVEIVVQNMQAYFDFVLNYLNTLHGFSRASGLENVGLRAEEINKLRELDASLEKNISNRNKALSLTKPLRIEVVDSHIAQINSILTDIRKEAVFASGRLSSVKLEGMISTFKNSENSAYETLNSYMERLVSDSRKTT